MVTTRALATTLRPLVGVVVVLFAWRTFAALDLTSLWNDELRTVEKSFQPSLPFLFQYLREDVHPPLYYVLVWLLGQLFGQTVLVLRGLSWFAYLLTTWAITRAVWLWHRSMIAATIASCLAVSLPFTVRFAVEGKAYSVVCALIALALWQRLRWLRGDGGAGPLYAIAYAAAALTHYYGLGLLLAQALVDGFRRDWSTFRWDAWALVIPTLWMLGSLAFLLGEGGRQWLPPASVVLLLKLATLALGEHWQLALALFALLCFILRITRRFGTESTSAQLVRIWGLDAAALLAVSSFVISVWRPSAFDRYYIVLLPASVGALSGWLGMQVQGRNSAGWRVWLLMFILAGLLVLFWGDAFTQIAPGPGISHRKGQDFRAVSFKAASGNIKISRQCRQLNASDYVLSQGGLLAAPQTRWRCPDQQRSLSDWLAQLDGSDSAASQPSGDLIFAVVGRRQAGEAVPVTADLEAIESAGYACRPLERLGPSTLVVRCRR